MRLKLVGSRNIEYTIIQTRKARSPKLTVPSIRLHIGLISTLVFLTEPPSREEAHDEVGIFHIAAEFFEIECSVWLK